MRLRESCDHVFLWSNIQSQWRYLDEEDLDMWVVFSDKKSHRLYTDLLQFSSRRVMR